MLRKSRCVSVKVLKRFTVLILYIFLSGGVDPFKGIYAQEGGPDKQIEEIDILGRKIKKIDLESSTPISVINRSQIEASGESSVGGLLRDAIEIDGVAAGSVSEPNSGRTVLMGMHSSPVLVLLNGQIFTTSPGTLLSPPGADVSLIPISSIERIEVLRDSVAAIYGAGAVGGVVNIITRSGDREGEVLLQHSLPREKGGSESHLSALKNFSGSRYNLSTAFGYKQIQPLIEGDRGYMSPRMSIFSSYPTQFIYDGRETPVPVPHKDCGKDGVSQINPQTGYCEMDVAHLRNAIPRIVQKSGFVNMSYNLSEHWTFFSRAMLSQKEVDSLLEPSPGVLYASDAPDFVFRFFEAGRRGVTEQSTFYDINFGLRSHSLSNWTWSHNFGLSSFRMDLEGRNFLQAREISNLYECRLGPDFALEEGDCDSGNSFDPFAHKGSRGDLSSALRNPKYREASALLSFNSQVEGELVIGELPIDVMGGGQFWRDTYILDAPQESYLIAPRFDDVRKQREAVSAFFGLGTLLLDSTLNVDFNIRWDSYSDSGSNLTSRLAFLTHLSPHVIWRGSVGSSFQAPSLLYRYGPSSNLFAPIVDKVACEEAQQQEREGDERASKNIAKYCSSQTIPTNVVSNENLGVESADTINMGVLFNPNQDFHIGLDWWYLSRHNYIGPILSNGTKLEYEGRVWPEDDVSFQRRFNGISGVTDIIRIDTTITNLNSNEVSGLDVSSFYSVPFWGGELSLSNTLTYTIFNRMQPFAQLAAEDKVGSYGYPRWRNNLSLSWGRSKFKAALLLRSYAGQKQESERARPLPTYSELDMTIDLKIFNNSTLNFGGKNILFSTPPTQDSQVNRFNNRLYSQVGSRFFVSYKYIY